MAKGQCHLRLNAIGTMPGSPHGDVEVCSVMEEANFEQMPVQMFLTTINPAARFGKSKLDTRFWNS